MKRYDYKAHRRATQVFIEIGLGVAVGALLYVLGTILLR